MRILANQPLTRRKGLPDAVWVLLLNRTHIPLSQPFSRPIIDLYSKVVRIRFGVEWAMMHGKGAVADVGPAEVAPANLNVASWFRNCERYAVIEGESFARQMADTYLQALTNAVKCAERGTESTCPKRTAGSPQFKQSRRNAARAKPEPFS
jgi:phosphatidylserine/phosphatidylglycerophosphate/cardiolipin synthase-like enzyme